VAICKCIADTIQKIAMQIATSAPITT